MATSCGTTKYLRPSRLHRGAIVRLLKAISRRGAAPPQSLRFRGLPKGRDASRDSPCAMRLRVLSIAVLALGTAAKKTEGVVVESHG